MKKALIILLLFVTFAANARGAKRNSGHIEDFKFGLQLKSIIPGNKIGGFVEYKVHQALGLQSGLFHFNDYYLMENQNTFAFVFPRYLSIPLILRYYPGSDAQFCLFAGLQASYLLGGFYLNLDTADFGKKIEEIINVYTGSGKTENKSSNSKAMGELAEKIENDDLSNWAFHFVCGLDYEYSGGFQWGLEIGHGLTQLFGEDYEDSLNFTAKMILGYNFAKLF